MPLPHDTRAVLIDLDGTLVDRDAALRDWMRKRAGMGAELPRLLALDAGQGRDLSVLSVELLRMRPGLAGSPTALAERIRRELPRHLRHREQINLSLENLRQAGLRTALVSNGGGETQRAKLAAASLDPALFDAVLISGELGTAKPDPAIFLAACEALGVTPAQTVMVGDCLYDDITAARALGMTTVWVSSGDRPPPLSTSPSAPKILAADFPAATEAILASIGRGRYISS